MPARFTKVLTFRLGQDDIDDIQAAAVRWYRGNRTDLIRDAVVQHLDRLYAGTTQPGPLGPRPKPEPKTPQPTAQTVDFPDDWE